jgi:hypothetical protein
VANEAQAKNVHEAILRVMAEVAVVPKNGVMKGAGNYKFTKESDVIEALRPAMLRHGLVAAPMSCRIVGQETYRTSGQRETVMNLVRAEVTWVIVHAPSGTSMPVAGAGEGADQGDKAVNKAMTAAKKYALLHAFLLTTDDDPDDESSEGQRRERDRDRDRGRDRDYGDRR